MIFTHYINYVDNIKLTTLETIHIIWEIFILMQKNWRFSDLFGQFCVCFICRMEDTEFGFTIASRLLRLLSLTA